MGGTLGYGETGKSTAAQLTTPTFDSRQDTKSLVVGGFVGHRFGRWGVEGGLLTLPEYFGTADTSDYPAYKGLPPGTYPQTASASQSIKAISAYGRVNVYGPAWKVTPYAFGGVAVTETRNHEKALYNGVDQAEYHATTYTARPMVGVGLNAGPARLEIIHINGASNSSHTLKRNVTMVTVGVVVRF